MSLLGNLTAKEKPVLRPRRLNEDEALQQKIFMYGASGTGKTKAIGGFLLNGLKLVGISTEAGGHGLRTVRYDLIKAGREDLLANLVFFELSSFQEVKEMLRDFKNVPISEGLTIQDFEPDLLFWDGFSNFQTNYIDEYVLGMEYAGKVDKVGGQMRQEGIVAGEKDWDAIGRVSKRYLDDFPQITLKDGKRPHIYMNCWELEPATPMPGREVKTADTVYRPALLGATRTLVSGYFDFVFRANRRQPMGKPLTYEYIVASSDCVCRQRGNDLDNIEPADMEALWKKINK